MERKSRIGRVMKFLLTWGVLYLFIISLLMNTEAELTGTVKYNKEGFLAVTWIANGVNFLIETWDKWTV